MERHADDVTMAELVRLRGENDKKDAEIENLKQTIIDRERQLVERDFQLIELRKMNEQNNEWGQELFKENELLREALKKILNPDNFENIFEIAEAALQQKDSE